MRLDRWFRIHFPELGYSYLQKLLRSGQVRVDSKRAQANDRLSEGQEIRVPAIIRQPKVSKPGLKAPPGVSKGDRDIIEKMILFEDDDVLVLNKPSGIAVQGGTGTKRHIDGMLAGMADRFGGDVRASSIASTATPPACSSSPKRATPPPSSAAPSRPARRRRPTGRS